MRILLVALSLLFVSSLARGDDIVVNDGTVWIASCDDEGVMTACYGPGQWCDRKKMECEKERIEWGPLICVQPDERLCTILPSNTIFTGDPTKCCIDFRQIGFRKDGVVVWRYRP